MGKRISLKSMQSNIFGRRKNTIGQPIQLKNTKESTILRNGEFDYLLVTISTKKDQYGMYLISFSKIKELLSESFRYNKKCDQNGYDGKGQIKLYIPDKSCCTAYIEMDHVMLKNLKKKYNCEVPTEQRNETWSNAIFGCIKNQLELSKITGEA